MKNVIYTIICISCFSLNISGQCCIDYGYGIDSINQQNQDDSLFSFNIFSSEVEQIAVQFNSKEMLDSNISINIKSKKSCKKYIYIDEKKYSFVSLFSENAIYNKIELDKIYKIKYNNKKYFILILKCNTTNSRIIRYRGFIIDQSSIFRFPDYQSTNSLLNIGDFNCDGKLDYAAINLLDPDEIENKVRFYEFQDGKGFNINKTFYINLLPIDGYIFKIDYENSIIPNCDF